MGPTMGWTVSGNCPGRRRMNLGRKDGRGCREQLLALCRVCFGAELEGWVGRTHSLGRPQALVFVF